MKIIKKQISELNPAKYNPRKDLKPGDAEYESLKRSMVEFDCVEPIIWNETSGNIVGGHQRLKILVDLGYEEIEVSVVNLNDQKEKALNIALNKISGEWDQGKLEELIKDLSSDSDFDLALTGFDLDELSGFLDNETEGLTDDDAVPEIVEEPITKMGDLWLLGEHRVLCGDAKKREDVERLMGGKKADMVFTDPPYGIKRSEGFEGFGGFGKPIARKKYKGGWDDDRPPKEVFDLIIPLADIALIFGGNYFADILPQGKHWVVWDKKNTMPTFGDCELIWTNIKRDSVKIKEFEFNGLIGKEKERFHATQKPVDLLVELLNEYGKENDLILDPFLGSGSTLIACEKTNRKCYGMEIDPHYCDIIIKRYEDYSGKKAVLET